MQTEAIFENITTRILQEILNAEKSIYIAVGWFTNSTLFEALIQKADEGCSINLILVDDEINKNSQIDFERLKNHGGIVYKISSGKSDLIHHKFCVIDYKTVISGSYNWKEEEENKFENIIGTSTINQMFIC
jgi:phosphatidylserine/phosphatidylglycerophosphate/cardiolipin synthase-like enzyme